VKDVQTANNEIEVEALICATVDQREAWGCSAKMLIRRRPPLGLRITNTFKS
jgi:hypothetical protein